MLWLLILVVWCVMHVLYLSMIIFSIWLMHLIIIINVHVQCKSGFCILWNPTLLFNAHFFQGDHLSIQEEVEEGEEERLVVSTQPSAESSGGSSPAERDRVNGVGVVEGEAGNNEDVGEDGITYPNPDVRGNIY